MDENMLNLINVSHHNDTIKVIENKLDKTDKKKVLMYMFKELKADISYETVIISKKKMTLFQYDITKLSNDKIKLLNIYLSHCRSNKKI